MRLDGLRGLAPDVGAHDPGYHLAVIADGEVVWEHVAGVANLDTGEPLTPGSVFYVGSLAKQFVAACAALLWRDGVLDVGAPVSTYVPSLPSWGDGVTLAHLIHHTAGLPRPRHGPDGLPPDGVPEIGNAARLARLASIGGLEADPGTRYAYSNDGYVLLAEAIAGAAGAPLAGVAAERIFDPLGMTDTRFRDAPDPLPPHAARGHFRATDGHVHIEPARFHVVGPGGLWTTARDLARWDANLDDDRLASGWLPVQLVTPGRLTDDTELHYAWGLSIRTHRGLPLVVHGGSFPGWESVSLRFPDRRVTVVCLANTEELAVRTMAFRAADHVLAEHLAPGAPPAAGTASD